MFHKPGPVRFKHGQGVQVAQQTNGVTLRTFGHAVNHGHEPLHHQVVDVGSCRFDGVILHFAEGNRRVGSSADAFA